MIPTELPSRRNRRRATRDEQFRESRRLFDRWREVGQQARKSVVRVELPEPVRAGWQRYWFVRPDLQRSPEGPYLERVLALVQRREVSNRRDFARRDWRHGNKMRAVDHHLGEVDAGVYWAMTDKMKTYFVPVARREKYMGRVSIRVTFGVAQPWKFVSRVRPNYQTHELVRDARLEAEEEWLYDQLFRGELKYRPVARWCAWGHGWRDDTKVRPRDLRRMLVEVGA